MRNLVDECRGQSNLLNEDKLSYQPGWKEVADPNSPVDEWHHRRAKELNGLPFWGKLDVYGGGGYLVPLRGSNQKIIDKLNQLEKADWIDGGTRAVFVEFSAYNAQVRTSFTSRRCGEAGSTCCTRYQFFRVISFGLNSPTVTICACE